MSLKIWCSILFIAISLNLSASETLFQEKFNLHIITEDSFKSSYESLSFEALNDSNRLNYYLTEILIPEFNKYPEFYFENIGLKQIVICKNLLVTEQQRAAAPDPFKNTLFLSLDSGYDKNYLIHVLHHELHHITEYALWQDMYYDWKKWNRKNPKNFAYGTGGQFAYIDGNENVDWYKINNPELGFINYYSTLGPEEDRCEIVAVLMTESERSLLNTFTANDKNLKRKVNLTLRTLSKISKQKLKYWKSKLY